MDGWMSGWVDGWVSGYVDEWMGGWMDGWIDSVTCNLTEMAIDSYSELFPVELLKVPTLNRYWNLKNVMLWALMRGFINSSDWPLSWHAHRRCLWLATMINARKCLNLKAVWKRASISGPVRDRRLLSNAPVCICVSTRWRESLMTVYNVFEALIIEANHRHIWWAHQHNTNVLSSQKPQGSIRLYKTHRSEGRSKQPRSEKAVNHWVTESSWERTERQRDGQLVRWPENQTRISWIVWGWRIWCELQTQCVCIYIWICCMLSENCWEWNAFCTLKGTGSEGYSRRSEFTPFEKNDFYLILIDQLTN